MVRKILVTGSAGHLGEAICRTLARDQHAYTVVGLDIKPSPFTTVVGSVSDRSIVKQCMQEVDAVLHTAGLHKPHVVTHTKQQFIETNITGTLILLEEAVAAHVSAFVLSSTTSLFGDSLKPKSKDDPAVWIDEQVPCIPKNIYGVTKTSAENMCRLFHRNENLPCIILRLSRFFPEEDDDPEKRTTLSNNNVKTNEFLNRRGSIDDMVSAHLCAMDRAPELGFGVYICSGTTPFRREDTMALRHDAPSVVESYHPEYIALYKQLGWKMDGDIGRVYDNSSARRDLGWKPRDSFVSLLAELANQYENGVKEPDPLSDLARTIGCKGYHDETFEEGPYPTSDQTSKAL